MLNNLCIGKVSQFAHIQCAVFARRRLLKKCKTHDNWLQRKWGDIFAKHVCKTKPFVAKIRKLAKLG